MTADAQLIADVAKVRLLTAGSGVHDRTVFATAQMLGDVVIFTLLSLLAFYLARRTGGYTGQYMHGYLYVAATLVTTVTAVFGFALAGIYDLYREGKPILIIQATIRVMFKIFLLLTGCFFLFKIADSFSRLWLTTWFAASLGAVCGFRLASFSLVQRLMRRGWLTARLVIVGANTIGRRLAANLAAEKSRLQLLGVYDQQELSGLDKLLAARKVDEVIIATEADHANRITELIHHFQPFPVSLRVIAPEGYERLQILDSWRIGDVGTLGIMRRPLNDAAVIVKWLEDKIIASLALIAMSPFMLGVGLLIKFDTRGPVLFRQQRLGANNRAFNLLKFRSMSAKHSDPLGRELTRPGDPRVTRVGRFIRVTSFDELPQLINVLRGDMSIVGPRPHPLAATAGGIPYVGAVNDYPVRHRVKPGITGWAQVNGWRGETRTVEQIRQRVEHDLYYIGNWSLSFDLAIIARTFFTVLSRKNAV